MLLVVTAQAFALPPVRSGERLKRQLAMAERSEREDCLSESMRMRIEPHWMAFIGLGTVAFIGTRPTNAQSGPEVSVRAILDRQVADWNKGDLEGFLSGYWNSPKVVFQSGGRRSDGWEAMRDRYRRRYQAEGKAMGRLVFSSVEIEPLGPEAIMVRGAWRLAMPDETKPGGLFTLIFRKLPEGWKIVHDHTSAEEPIQQAPSEKPARE
jgi:ketosteroid isomerase-like protein